MATYTVTVTEISKGRFEVEASSQEEAVKKFEEQYWHNSLEYSPFIEPYDTLIE